MIDHEPSDREKNRALSRSEFGAGATILCSKPRALFIELTRQCNLQCQMCRGSTRVSPLERMSDSLFERVEAELFPTADLIDLRGWGESTILPEFPDRARRAARYGAALRVVTNLCFRRKEILDVLSEMEFYVAISLDSADPETLNALRCGADLAIIQRNLALLAKNYQKRDILDRLNLHVTCQRPALLRLEQIIDVASAAGITDVRLAPVTVDDDSPLALASARSDVMDMLERMKERAKISGIRVSLAASLIEGLTPNRYSGCCLHPWAWCYVTYDGRIGFCDHLIGPAGDPYIIGSLQSAPFESIWNGSEWTSLRREHLANNRRMSEQLFEECAFCYRNRHLDYENILEPELEGRRCILQ